MSDNETTLEDKLYTAAILFLFVCLGYWMRSLIQVALFDGLIMIIGICLAVLVIIGAVLLQYDRSKT